MAIQNEDSKTADIFNIEPAIEEAHLAREHGLVKVSAYIKDASKAEKKTSNAARQERHREKLREAQLVQMPIPKEIAEAVKNTEGGFPAWLEAQKAVPVQAERVVEVEKIIEKEVRVEVPVTVERIVEVPAQLTGDQKRLIDVGRAVESATGLRLWIIKSLLGKA